MLLGLLSSKNRICVIRRAVQDVVQELLVLRQAACDSYELKRPSSSLLTYTLLSRSASALANSHPLSVPSSMYATAPVAESLVYLDGPPHTVPLVARVTAA